MSIVTGTDSVTRSSRSIQEFWIDFLLEEEFNASNSFSAAFLAACDSGLRLDSVISVAHSVSDKHGEADLIVLVSASGSDDMPKRVALLIEDKITAGFQPRQAERYRLRGDDGLVDGKWERFITVLVAPAAYLSKSLGFDITISFESLKNWIAPNDQKRREFKLRRLDEAIRRKNTSGVQIVDPVMTAFRQAYYEHLSAFNAREGTDYRMRTPKDTYWGDTWFVLKSVCLPEWSFIRHKASPGHVDLTFKDTDLRKVDGLPAFLESDMTLISNGKYQQHVTIRINVPKILAFDNFDSISGVVETVFKVAARLSGLFERNRTAFEGILTAARRTSVAVDSDAIASVATSA